MPPKRNISLINIADSSSSSEETAKPAASAPRTALGTNNNGTTNAVKKEKSISLPWLTDAEQAELIQKVEQLQEPPPTMEDDENNSLTELSSLPETSFYEHHCWICSVRLKELNGEPCLYGLCIHPLLAVPVCSLCLDHLQQQKQLKGNDDESENEDDSCHGCHDNEESDVLFLCDCCPRQFCIACVSKSIGGGTKGMQRANSLLNCPDVGWACLVCSPPQALEAIQIMESTTITNTNNNANLSQADIDKRTIKLFETLMAVENELVECEKYGTYDWLEEQKRKFKIELAEQYTTERAEERATEELALYEQLCLKHYQRLMDHVDMLQEQLECLGFDWRSYYKTWKDLAPEQQNGDNTNQWRAHAETYMPRVKPLQEESSYDDSLSDVSSIEDLGDDDVTLELEMFKDKKDGWSGTGPAYRDKVKGSLPKRLNAENARLEKFGRHVKYVRDEDDDKANQNEQRNETFVTIGGDLARRSIQRPVALRKTRRAPAFIKPTRTHSMIQSTARVDKSKMRRIVPKLLQSQSPQPFPKEPLTNPSVSNEYVNGKSTQSTASTDKTTVNGLFEGSSLVLCTKDNASAQRSIAIATPLASKMKFHQVEGIKFLWEKVCGDLTLAISYEEAKEEKNIGGAILAHFMGLGKTAVVISLLHTLLNHPSLELPPVNELEPRRFIKRVLLIAPVNTLENWMNEFRLWTDPLEKNITVYNFHVIQAATRVFMIQEWFEKGGVLLIGDRAYANISREKQTNINPILSQALHSPGPDLIILDECHTMLKNITFLSNALGIVRTKRRIALTGTPFQNNLREYYRMASWVRPGVLGSEASFNKIFMKPIEDGMAGDAEPEAVAMQVEKSTELYKLMEAFTQRRDNAILKEQLPPLQEAILHIRQSPLQRSLYAAFKKHSALKDDSNFFRAYGAQLLVNNHPGALLIPPRNKPTPKKPALIPFVPIFQSTSSPKNVSDVIELLSDTDDDDDQDAEIAPQNASSPSIAKIKVENQVTNVGNDAIVEPAEGEWWKPVYSKKGKEYFNRIEQGNKIVLLLQILAHSQEIEDKVVIFSQSLATLDFIEKILSTQWALYVNNRKNLSSSLKLDCWKRDVDYFRIDGGTSAAERGALITTFNNGIDSKAFLISIEAGGIGINLCGANRVVIMDNHFNPSISSQAISRCWRYGQEKPVYAYRLLTEGSMEEKIVANLSKKSGLGARVVDQEYPERTFTRRELTEMRNNDKWIACDKCDKWRMLIFETDEEVEELQEGKWFCHMNQDIAHNKCSIAEHDTAWYGTNMSRLIRLKDRTENNSSFLDAAVTTSDSVRDAAVLKRTKQMVKHDMVLKNLGALELLDKHKSGGEAISPAKPPKKMRIAAMLIGKVYYPDLLSTHSTKDLDTAAAYQKSCEKMANDTKNSEQQISPGEAVGSNTAMAPPNENENTATSSVTPQRSTKHANSPKDKRVSESVSIPKRRAPVAVSTTKVPLVAEIQQVKREHMLSISAGGVGSAFAQHPTNVHQYEGGHHGENLAKKIKINSSPSGNMSARREGSESEPLEILSDSD